MTDFLASRDLLATEKALQDLVRRADLTVAQYDEAVRRAEQLRADVAAAKGRSALEDEMRRQLEAVQHRAHERSVGAFERLLTAILTDVLPDEGAVKLALAMKNNSTWLNVMLEKAGHVEDALESNGGAVANVLSTGLRFAALSRTTNRRVMVLDEAECWVQPHSIAAYVNVIAKISQSPRFGFQTFFVSHHDIELFEQSVNVLELARDRNGKVFVKAESHVGRDWANDEEVGIRAIELVNVRQHEHTVMRFRPGATAIVGVNNLGKSTAIQSSLKAVAYGESGDEIIRHGCTSATIVIHLEHNRRLVWNRDKTRSPVVQYQLYEGDKLVEQGRPNKRSEAPAWVVKILGISRIDDLDVQLRSQKSPVFLLDDTASRRAQVLSIGRESGHLAMLFAEYNAVKAQDAETERSGEAEYARIQWRLRGKPSSDELPEQGMRTQAAWQALKQRKAQLDAIEQGLASLAASKARIARLRLAAEALTAAPPVPTVANPETCGILVGRLDRAARVRAANAQLLPAVKLPEVADPAVCAETVRVLTRAKTLAQLKLPPVPKIPTAVPPTEIIRLGAAIRRGFTLRAIAGKMKPLQPPTVVAPLELAATVEVLQRARVLSDGFKRDQAALIKEEAQVAQELKDLRETLGDHCPLCGGNLPEHGFLHVH